MLHSITSSRYTQAGNVEFRWSWVDVVTLLADAMMQWRSYHIYENIFVKIQKHHEDKSYYYIDFATL